MIDALFGYAKESSPPTRGCSAIGNGDAEAAEVLPADAGVLR